MYQTTNIYITAELKMSDVILNNPYLFLLLEHFGIDVPLQNKSLKQVCEDSKVNIELFLTFANLYNGIEYSPKTALNFNETLSIIDYLKSSHKFYTDEIYPNILHTIEQMAEVNKEKEMALVTSFFIDYFNEVREHLDYEHTVVFPYILDLHGQIENRTPIRNETTYSVMEYREHHDDIEEKLNDLKSLLIKYLPHNNDQSIRRKLLFLLSEFEYDISIHSKIEDLILIPLVAKMESDLTKQGA